MSSPAPRSFLSLLLSLPLVAAQLSGSVGPSTSRSAKAAVKVCNIMSYGGVASATTDNSAAINAAWNACKSGGEVYIPSGNYGLSTWVTLDDGKGVSFNLEGIIYRIGTAGGTMIGIENTQDFEFYSANSQGAMQGYGYEMHGYLLTKGQSLKRLFWVSDFSVHDIALVDAPEFHLVMDTCSNGEVYNMIVRGGSLGGLDGVDVWGTNIWIHDVEVTNKDECVTVKSPSSNILVESIFCNWSGGCAIGSLGAGTSIKNILYRNIYTQNSNQMFMIKSNGGSGSLVNGQFNNFIGHSNAYTLDLNAFWSSETTAAGSGVQYANLSFSGWQGTCLSGTTRAPIQVFCPTSVPCTEITISDYNVWTQSGSEVLYKCENAYGTGGCLRSGSSGTYTSTATVETASDYAIQTMPGEITSWGSTTQIAIPAIPTTFFPGLTPTSALLG